MDIRHTTSPYIDMDDLAKPWEVNRRLSYEVIEREYMTKGTLKQIASEYYPKKDKEVNEQEQVSTEKPASLTLRLK